MARSVTHQPRIVQLADRIAADVRQRRLKPGDAYLTTAAAAQMLGISTTAANRAMQLLVQRHVLNRRQRTGTTVAAGQNLGDSPLRRVHLLVHRHFLKTEGLLADGLILGIQQELPNADLQFDFQPPGGDPNHVKTLLARVLAARQPEGIVLNRAALEVQRLAAQCGLPVVLAGTPFPSVRGLASIDKDQRQLGLLLGRHLVERGADWLGLLMREDIRQGDHLVIDGVRDALAEAGRPPDALTLRCLPNDPAEIRTLIDHLIASCSGPGGLICRSVPLADTASATLGGREARRIVGVAVCDAYMPAGGKPRYPTAQPVLLPQERGARIARMLVAQIGGHATDPQHVTTPVELIVPDRPRSAR